MCQIENIKNIIANEYGFDSWNPYFEYFNTTEPGRKIIQKGIDKAIKMSLLLSDFRHSCPNCIVEVFEDKQRA